MIYITHYNSFVGTITLASKKGKLIGLWIEGQSNYLDKLEYEVIEKDDEDILIKAKNWLDRYFNNEKTSISELDISPIGSEFQKEVWDILMSIPYGKVITYKDIASSIAAKRGIGKMSSQAVGGAVGKNPISIIIPCHRVVGTDRNLTGYAGGVDIKIKLLKHEGHNIDNFKIPKKGKYAYGYKKM